MKASSEEELLESLEAMPSVVGSRLKRRSIENKENFVLKNYLKNLATINRLKYPLEISKNESPDFLLVEAGFSFGIEITESTFENYQYFLTEAERRGHTYSPSAFKYGVEYSREEIVKFLGPPGSKIRSRAWGGTQAELYASGWAKDSLLRKMATVENWPSLQRRNLRILLYQNCPGWIANIEAFVWCFKKRLNELSQPEKERIQEIKIDYLSSSGKKLGYDILGEGLAFSLDGDREEVDEDA